MEQYLYKYLLLNRKLCIPGLGNFMVEYKSAYYNEPTGLLFPRKPVIEFYEAPGAIAERNLFYFLSKEMGMDELPASNAFQHFCASLVSALSGQQFIEIEGIGKIKKEARGRVTFIPATSLIDILPPLRFGEKTKGYKPVELVKVVKAVEPAIIAETVKEVEAVKAVIGEEAEFVEAVKVAKEVVGKEVELVKEVKEVKEMIGEDNVKEVVVWEPRVGRPSSPELEALNAEVERIRKANELRAIKENENTGAVVVAMRGGLFSKMKSIKESWWLYPAVLALIGLIALLVKVL